MLNLRTPRMAFSPGLPLGGLELGSGAEASGSNGCEASESKTRYFGRGRPPEITLSAILGSAKLWLEPARGRWLQRTRVGQCAVAAEVAWGGDAGSARESKWVKAPKQSETTTNHIKTRKPLGPNALISFKTYKISMMPSDPSAAIFPKHPGDSLPILGPRVSHTAATCRTEVTTATAVPWGRCRRPDQCVLMVTTISSVDSSLSCEHWYKHGICK